ncbi:hypothetical protein E3E51_08635 [Thermococcus sp. 21S7]|nr:hypothetical protein [Thermococcus sp. 21S7]
MKMRIIFDKEYDILEGVYKVSVRSIDLDDELKAVIDGIEPVIKVNGTELTLKDLLERTFEGASREEAEKTMSQIRSALVESFSSLIARFKEAQSFNGSVVHEIDFNEL